MKKPYPMVSVEWADSGAHIEHGWEPVEKIIARAHTQFGHVHTVGVLIHEDDEMVVVVLSYDESSDATFGAQAILQSNIVRLRRLMDVA